MMLVKYKFVRCIFVDFFKAFDVVDHCILLEKLNHLHVTNYIVYWIKSFLSYRMQATKFDVSLSTLASINRSKVQGSGLGPVLFIMFAIDLVTLDELNYLLKCADGVTLLNHESATGSVETEIANIMEWARKKNDA
jgi:Reverse transcriptase (RNA-dependent DNA polymerase)